MTKITLDASVLKTLTATNGAVDLCDEHGNSVGVFDYL
jgi:hypothetical protein